VTDRRVTLQVPRLKRLLEAFCNNTFTLLYDDPTQDGSGQEVENLVPVTGAEDIPCMYHTKQIPGQFTDQRTWIGVAAIILTFETFIISEEDTQLAVQVNGQTLYVREASVQDSQSLAQMFICTELRDG